MRTHASLLSALGLGLALTACPGGGDDTTDATDPTQPLTSGQDTSGSPTSEPTSTTAPGTDTTDTTPGTETNASTPGTETTDTTPPATDTTDTTPPETETTNTTPPDDTGPGETSTGPDDTSTGPGETSTGPDDTSTGDEGLSFEADVYPVVVGPNCGCHVQGSGGLKMGNNAGNAYQALVDQPSGNGGLDYVEPGDPDASYFWHKINGTQGMVMGGAGSQMPLGGMLSPDEIDLVTQWISQGALP
ncbi:MAG: hypothetical protein JNL82_28430 [Myxococcales bacterium]|nr:hypothetical protein [Myxococcales bacterium]